VPPTPGTATDTNIGNPAIAGSASVANGVYTVKGAGVDIWGTSDQFNFDYWPVSGDMTITARVTGITNTNFYAKAGVMIRETLSSKSTYALALGDPTLFNFGYRTTTGANAASAGYFNASYPLWLRVVRAGNTFTGYSSSNGQTWQQINSPVTINMAAGVYAGLAVTACNPGQLNTATFDNVVITTP
jgi:regulation of enolase protein 1 (concanavalin A-like superfamily)